MDEESVVRGAAARRWAVARRIVGPPQGLRLGRSPAATAEAAAADAHGRPERADRPRAPGWPLAGPSRRAGSCLSCVAKAGRMALAGNHPRAACVLVVPNHRTDLATKAALDQSSVR